VLCIFMYMWIAHAAGYSAHAGRAYGGGGMLVVINPNTIAENVTTQRHSQR